MNPYAGTGPSSGIPLTSSSKQQQPMTSSNSAPEQASSQGSSSGSTVKYPVYLSVNDKKCYNILKFSTPVDFSKWTQVTASRDLSVKKLLESQSSLADEMPEYGAGSEYGRKAREEAWRRRRGMALAKKVSVKDLPIRFKTGENKQYVGKKEGGVDEHSSYFIMCLNHANKPANQNSDGAPQGSSAPQGSLPASMNVDSFQLLPVNAWFSASTAVTYKTLDDEEAEEEFSRRDKILNHFSLMLQKRLKDEQAEEEGEEGTGSNVGLGRLNPSEMNLNSMVQASVSAGSGGASALVKKLTGGTASSALASKVYYKNSLKNPSSALKISDYDEDYMSSSDEDENESGGDGDGEDGEGRSKKKKKSKKTAEEDEKPKVVGGKKKQKDDDVTREENEEIEEESDDGEFEGLELDYNEAESSPSEEEEEEENEQVADDKKAVPEELDKVLEDEDLEDDDDEEGERQQKDSAGEGGSKDGEDGGKSFKEGASLLSSKSDKKRKGIATSGADDSSDDDNDSSSDEDPDQMTSVLFLSNTKKSAPSDTNADDVKTDASKPSTSSDGVPMTEKQKKTADILSNVKAETSKSGKRKAEGGSGKDSKKQKIDPTKGDAFEALITKYCQRKATSTGELLVKLRKLRPDMDKDEIVKKMVATMKNLGLKSKKVGGKTLWSMQ